MLKQHGLKTMICTLQVSPEVPQHEAADKIPSQVMCHASLMFVMHSSTMLKTDRMLHSVQVPNQLGGERFPDPLEADTTVTGGIEKALPKDKAQ